LVLYLTADRKLPANSLLGGIEMRESVICMKIENCDHNLPKSETFSVVVIPSSYTLSRGNSITN